MLGPMRRMVMVVAAIGLAAGCKSSSPKTPRLVGAGSPTDDGSGFLAKASVKFMTSTDEGGFEPDVNRNPYEYDYSYQGFTYGGFGADGYGYGGSPYASYNPYSPWQQPTRPQDYAISYATDHGAIDGTITWPKPPKAPATLAGPPGCGDVANPSLKLGSGGAVEGAVVYLEKITAAKQPAIMYGYYKPISTGGTVELRDCALSPRVQVYGPVPGAISVSNALDVPIAIAAERTGDGASRIEHKLEVGGSKLVPVNGAGVMRIGDQAGQLAPAWVIAASHPYYTLTDHHGRFRLDEVVPGDYTLVVWHPPVVTGVVDGVVQYGEPVMLKKKVSVKKLTTSKVDLAL